MSKDIDDATNDIVRIDISEDDNTVSPPLNSRGVGEMVASEKKCTSCEQKVEQHETDDRQHNTLGGSNADTVIISIIR